jgi:hypothetical protein
MELTKEYFDEQLKRLATKNDLDELKTDVAGINQRVTATDRRVDNLTRFLDENMVTSEEFDNRLDELPTRKDFNQLQVSVDGIAKHFEEQKQEQIIGAERASRMEAWIIKAATKIGVQYKP